MGGQWWFNFILEKKDTFDIKAYQSLLPKLKAEFEPQFQAKQDDFQVFWCPDDSIPPKDNIYAMFTYPCTKPGNWKNSHFEWYLFWDPTIMPQFFCQSILHGKTGPDFAIGIKLQERLVEAFPDHFDYENDYKNRHCTSYYDDSDPNEEEPDYTACNKECGYCGKCPY